MRKVVFVVLTLSFATGACTSYFASKPEPSSDGPPLVNGYYVEPGDRCGESCPTFGTWVATGETAVYERAEAGALVIANISPGDRVKTSPGQTLVRPLRGTVQKPGGGLNAGDVVYRLLDDGEGFTFDVWRDGKVLNVEAEGTAAPVIVWDEPGSSGPSSIWWVQVELADGRKGWLRNPYQFDGMGPLS
jgi:hypothetical protein